MKKFMPFKKSSVPPADDNPYSPPPPAYDENPYASQAPAQNDPYAMKSGPPSARGPAGGLPSGPGANRGSPAPSAGSGGGYAADRYGASGGYGSNRYDNDPPRAGSRGPGGYGGLGRTNSAPNDDDNDGRDNLFAGRERVQQQQPPPGQDSRPPGPPRYGSGGDDGSGRGELFGGARERYDQAQRQPARRGGEDDEEDAYGGYGAPRELTAEEEEEQEVADTKARIKELKQESAASSARSLAAGQAALEASRSTMARLGAQGERLHNTEKNLDMAASHNKVAQQQTSKLKSLNRSMFAVHVNNPFTATAKEERRREELLAEHQAQRAQREETRRMGNQTNSRVEQALKDMSLSNDEKPQFQRNLAARAKYQFEDDDEDDEAEDQIEENITQLETVTKGLHQASMAIGRELDQQNKLIDQIGKKSDLVDDQVRLNRDRLARIR